MTVNELSRYLNEKIPRELSCSWDNDGLMCCPDGEREVKKALFWQTHYNITMNERQIKIINMLWKGFEGKLTTSKWAKITKTSQATALRDITFLVEKRILVVANEGGRSTNYLLKEDY